MSVEDLFDQLKVHEGTGPMKGGRFFPYTDTIGKVTIGYGRNLTDRGLSADEVEMLLNHDMDEAAAAAAEYPWFRTLDGIRQRVVVDMIFNLGAVGFSKFKATIAAIASGDYVLASDRMLKSKWAGQVGKRARTLARMMSTGLEQ